MAYPQVADKKDSFRMVSCHGPPTRGGRQLKPQTTKNWLVVWHLQLPSSSCTKSVGLTRPTLDATSQFGNWNVPRA